MHWLILIRIGIFETLFAFCLGKANWTSGKEQIWWFVGFVVCLTLSMGLLIKAT